MTGRPMGRGESRGQGLETLADRRDAEGAEKNEIRSSKLEKTHRNRAKQRRMKPGSQQSNNVALEMPLKEAQMEQVNHRGW